MEDRKDIISKTYFKLIYYSELYSSNYEDRIKIYNKLLSENTVLTQKEKEVCQDRASRNTEREKELFKRGEPMKCSYCKLKRYSTRYCENCIIKYLKSFFGSWTSGCDIIDKFIRECQSNSGLPLHIMEWIPFDQFDNIEHFAKGGFATIYTATWKRGSILDFKDNAFVYQGSQKVVLKSLNNSSESTEKFFEEAKKFIQIRSGDIVNAYGITKIDSDNFAIVMNYFADGNLRDYLKKNHATLSLQDRQQLASEIVVNNLRPPELPEIPSKIQNLIYRCWNADPSMRPTIEEVYEVVKNIYCEILENSELATEYEKKRNKVAFDSTPSNTDSQRISSRIIDFEIKDLASNINCFESENS
ncbi:6139_t:CDS:2, partial [Scutellospora calospora]